MNNSAMQQPPGGGAPPGGALPDLNAETNPFEAVQEGLDRAAFFNLFANPVPRRCSMIKNADGAVIGFNLAENLHRLFIHQRPPGAGGCLKACNTIDSSVSGSLRERWLWIPDRHRALPDGKAPDVPFDPCRPQRFVILDSHCKFGSGQDGFRAFGAGRSFPGPAGRGGRVRVGAIATILEGYGKFQGLEGTLTYAGTLDPRRGFVGNLNCRVADPRGVFKADSPLPRMRPMASPERGVTYLAFGGQKKDSSHRTSYSFGPVGQVDGLLVPQHLRLFYSDSAAVESDGLRAVFKKGPYVGTGSSKVLFNPLNPGAPGTNLSPIPFSAANEFTFVDSRGQSVGSFQSAGGEGRTFTHGLESLPGQQALRFGAVQELAQGKGCFKGIRGLLTDNSAVGIAPHVIATIYVLRVEDPDGRYKTAFGSS